MVDARSLIPELAGWDNGAGIDVESWINAIGRYDHAIGYATIFWPDFFLHDDCVFRHPIDSEGYDGWMAAAGGNQSKVEATVNHRHILDLFCNSEFEPGRDVLVYLGSLLKEMWSCKLRHDFPDRTFEVIFDSDDVADLLDYQITFYQPRSETGRDS